MNSFFIRLLGRLLGIALGLLTTAAHAQVSNMWTLSYPPKFSATYFDNIDLTNPKVTRLDWAIDFDWNNYPYYTGSPDPTIATNTFSARWTGRVMPLFSENYTFHTISDDGIRVWVNDQLIIDRWVDQAATEHSSAPIPLTAGVEIDIKVEYYQGPGLAVARLLWSSPSQPKVRIAYPGTNPTGFLFGNWFHDFGARMVSLGNGRFVATTPSSTEPTVGSDGFFTYTGFGWIYDQSSRAVGYPKTPQYRSSFGKALAAFPDGRFLASGVVSNQGRIYLHDSSGNLLRTWSDPDTNALYLAFGNVITTLPGNRFAASGVNKVFVYDSGTVAAPVSVITNPAPASLDFVFSGGESLSGWGTNRILIPAMSSDGASRRVLVFDLNGAQRAAISSPTSQAGNFGNSIVVIDDQRVLISAPYAPVTYFTGSRFATNGSAGAVYLLMARARCCGRLPRQTSRRSEGSEPRSPRWARELSLAHLKRPLPGSSRAGSTCSIPTEFCWRRWTTQLPKRMTFLEAPSPRWMPGVFLLAPRGTARVKHWVEASTDTTFRSRNGRSARRFHDQAASMLPAPSRRKVRS
ncbi:MAG: hypothetical protein IPK15_27105 [Verrucomicrobia bacterium]|nr:hypothetical protein [Verrucomicrobiota bacterium]